MNRKTYGLLAGKATKTLRGAGGKAQPQQT